MSTLLEWQKAVVSQFNGPKPELNLDDLQPGDALEAQNVEYGKGSFQTRRPFAELLTSPSGNVQSFVNWIQTGFNRVVYFSDSGFGAELRSLDLKTHVDISLGGVLAATETFQASEAGTRLYAAMVKSDSGSGLKLPVGADRAVAIGQTPNSSSYQADPLWPAPLDHTQISFSVSEFGLSVGNVTPGEHKIVLVAQSRSGFQLVPLTSIDVTSIIPNDPNTGYSFVSEGGTDIITTNFIAMPAEVTRVQIAVTPVGSTRYFIVPVDWNDNNSSVGFANGTSWGMPFDVDDVTLMRGTEITDLFNNYYYGANNLQLKPFNTINFGNRMGYMAQLPDTTLSGADQTVMYFSAPGYYQNLNLAKSLVQLPGIRRGCAWFALRGVLYVLGPTYTYAFQDTNITPVKWSDGQLVDGQLGCSRQTALWANPGMGYAWIANESGLWRFTGGMFPTRDGAPIPNSYYQTPIWNRINFNTDSKGIWVVEVPKERQVHVFCALDGAISPTHWLTWDYNNGTEPENIKFSMCSLPVLAAGILMNPTTARTELNVAPAVLPSHIWRLTYWNEPGVVRGIDIGTTPYKTIYESGPTPSVTDYPVALHELHFRCTGNGTAVITAYSMDRTRTQSLTPINLQSTLDAPVRRMLDTQSSGETFRIEVEGGDILMTQYTVFYDPVAALV